jgi:hypothetical protein
MIRIRLPHPLQVLAGCGREVTVRVEGAVTQRTVLHALETRYPMLRGTLRDHVTMQRRPMVRFFADGQDVTHASPDAELPATVAAGTEPLIIIGAVAGG